MPQPTNCVPPVLELRRFSFYGENTLRSAGVQTCESFTFSSGCSGENLRRHAETCCDEEVVIQTLPLSSTSHDNQLPVSARRQHTNHDKKGEELEARKLLKAFAFATLNRRCSIA